MRMDKLSVSPNHQKEEQDVNITSLSGNILCISETESSTGSKEPRIKCRYIVILMGFTIYFFFLAQRMTIVVGIVDMVNNSALPQKENAESESCLSLITNTSDDEYSSRMDYDKIDGEFIWSSELQGYVLGGSAICIAITTPFVGKLIQLFGCKKVLFWAFFLSSACTFISPFAAWCHVYLLILAQSLRGLFQGCFPPAVAVLMANWCPKSERGFLFGIALSGSCWGAVFGSYFSGLLCTLSILGGWPFAFFIFGGTGIIVSLLIAWFLHDNPRVHPKISEAELQNILKDQGHSLTQKRPKTPWFRMLTSIPVYALAFAFVGQTWAAFLYLSVYSTFLGTILHYSMEQNGLFSALPFLLRFFTTVASGWLSSVLEKKYMTITMARKFWNFLACLGYSVCLLGIYFAGCNRLVSVVFGIASMACLGFADVGCYVVAADMSPRFAASVMSVATVGIVISFFLPVLVGYLTNGMQTIEQWNKIFFITIGVVMSSGVVFSIFGSAEVQPWNEVQEDGAETKDKKTRLK